MGEKTKTGTMTALSSLWNGSELDRVRGGDGASKLYGKRLSMHLMMQEDLSGRFLRDGVANDQGLLSRILIAWPESTIGTRLIKGHNRQPRLDLNTDPAMLAYRQTLTTLLQTPPPTKPGTRNHLQPRSITLTEPAYELWTDFHDAVELEMAEGGRLEALTDFGSKLAEHAARIAGVLAMIDNLYTMEIRVEFMQSAIKLMDYYLSEALRIRHGAAIPLELKQAAKLLEWAKEHEFIYTSQVYRLGPNSIRTKGVAEAAITTLQQHGWLLKIPGGQKIEGVHRKDVWKVYKEGNWVPSKSCRPTWKPTRAMKQVKKVADLLRILRILRICRRWNVKIFPDLLRILRILRICRRLTG